MTGLPKFKLDLDDSFLSLMDDASEVSGKSETSSKKTNAKEVSVINIEINDSDDEISSALKILINESELTNQELYDIKGQRNAYNMIYSFQKKGQLGIDRIKAWCKILHKKPILSFVDMTEEEIRIADKELEEEKINLENKKKKK